MANVPGTLALVGAGEFLPSMRRIDRQLLSRAGGRRVAVLPTASALDGPDVPQRWARAGVRHFTDLGAEAVAVMVLRRAEAAEPGLVEAVRRADLVYMSGGKPGHLLATLPGTPLWEAIVAVLGRGGVVAGCSAGAMILGGWIPGRFSFRRLSFWQPAGGLVPGTLVVPHFDELPRWAERLAGVLIPRQARLVGIDGGTALVVHASRAEVWGHGRVVSGAGKRRRVYTEGQTLSLVGGPSFGAGPPPET